MLHVHWNLIYIKTTLGTNNMWSLYMGGLYMKVQKHENYILREP